MISLECDGYIFSFADALDAFKFDDQNPTSPHYHGVPMKAVDMIVEFEKAYVFIEMKEFHDTSDYYPSIAKNEEGEPHKDAFKWLTDYLKYKYRDSYLYRFAEDRVDKPVHYICLLNFENNLCVKMKNVLQHELPVGKKSKRWKHIIAESCQVMNMQTFSHSFPKWSINKLQL